MIPWLVTLTLTIKDDQNNFTQPRSEISEKRNSHYGRKRGGATSNSQEVLDLETSVVPQSRRTVIKKQQFSDLNTPLSHSSPSLNKHPRLLFHAELARLLFLQRNINNNKKKSFNTVYRFYMRMDGSRCSLWFWFDLNCAVCVIVLCIYNHIYYELEKKKSVNCVLVFLQYL